MFAILRHNKIKSTTKGVAVAHNHRLIPEREEQNAIYNFNKLVEQAPPANRIIGMFDMPDVSLDGDGHRNGWLLSSDISAGLEQSEEAEDKKLQHERSSVDGATGLIPFSDSLPGRVSIDKKLSYLNEYDKGKGAVGRINAKLPDGRRKDAVESVEVLLTASPEFFNLIEADRKKLAVHPKFLAWCDATRAYAKKEFGENLVDLCLHMDESSPHFHALFVPLTKDGRLCGKEMTSRKMMQDRQTSYAETMAHFGLERGISAIETKRKHIPLQSNAAGGSSAAEIAALQEALRIAEQAAAQAKAAAQEATAKAKAEASAKTTAQTALASVQGDLAKATAAAQEATAKAKAEASAKTMAQTALASVQGDLAKATAQTVRDAKALKRLVGFSQADVETITNLRTENEKLASVQGDLAKSTAAAQEATAKAKAEASAKTTAQKALASVQGDLAKATAQTERDEKTIARLKTFSQTDVKTISNLEKENAMLKNELKIASERDHMLVTEITELRKERPSAQPTSEHLRALDRVMIEKMSIQIAADKDALLAKYPGIAAATKADLLGKTPVADSVLGLAVVSLGRDRFAYVETRDKKIPVGQLLTQQQIEGIGR